MDFQILLFDIVTVFLIPYMREIYNVPLEQFHFLLTIIGTNSPCSAAINSKKDSVSDTCTTTSIKDYSTSSHASSTTVELFAQEMKY